MSQLLNIWFNRTYDTNYWLIKDLQTRSDSQYNIKVYATHTDATSPVLQAADHVSLEPQQLSPEDYVTWCLQYCEDNHINIMIPVRSQIHIMKNKARFNRIGVTLIASSVETVQLFEDKNVAYMNAAEAGVSVPPWGVATDEKTFVEVYNKLRQQGSPLIIKPVQGVGAEGFYTLTDKPSTLNSLLQYHKTEIKYSDLIASYRESEKTGEGPKVLMVMPWLDDPEMSIDCLVSSDGELLRAVSRIKVGSRLTQFASPSDKILDQLQILVSKFNLRYIFNVQLRWFNNEPVLLEVNTRVSGGLFSVLEYTKENFVWEAIKSAIETSTLKPDFTSVRDGSYIPLNTSIPAKMLAL